MVWDGTMLSALSVYARNNQAVLVTPFIMAGAMAPASTAGAIAQLNAEVLAGIAFAQLMRPGAPMVYGMFATTVSMQSGAPMMGTPEPAQMIYVATQLARKYGVPVRAGGMLNGSKIADAQAAYESVATMIPTLMAGTNFILHSAGWLEAGLAAGYGKFMLDADQIAMLQQLRQAASISRRRTAPGGRPRGRARRPLSRLRPHPAQLQDRVLYLADRRQQQLRAVGGRRREGRQPARHRGRPAPAGAIRAAAAGSRHRRSAAGFHGAAEGGTAERGDVKVSHPPQESSSGRLRR